MTNSNRLNSFHLFLTLPQQFSMEREIMEHLGPSRGSKPLSCSPTVKPGTLSLFLQNLTDLELKVKKKLQNSKDSSAKLQRTPAFLHGLVQTALQFTANNESISDLELKDIPSIPAKGGFSDVGRHTGSEPRDTSWGLARETVRVSPSEMHVLDDQMKHLNTTLFHPRLSTISTMRAACGTMKTTTRHSSLTSSLPIFRFGFARRLALSSCPQTYWGHPPSSPC